jgi:hypothetical protein
MSEKIVAQIDQTFLNSLWEKKKKLARQVGTSQDEIIQEQLRKAVQILTDLPMNYSEVARQLKISRQDVLDMISDYPDVFNLVEDSYLDDLTATFMNVVAGREDAKKGFNLGNALKVLQLSRPELWRMRKGPSLGEEVKKGLNVGALFSEPVANIFEAREAMKVKDITSQKKIENFALGVEDDLNMLDVTEGTYAHTSTLDEETTKEETGSEEETFYGEEAFELADPDAGDESGENRDEDGELRPDEYFFTEKDFLSTRD